jgi:TatD DNase family protein
MTEYIDSHAHLDHEDFVEGAAPVLGRARTAGVVQIVVVASSLKSTRSSMALAVQHPNLFATAGIHPHDVAQAPPDDLAAVETLAHDDHVVAVGETGLDYHYDFSPREVQREYFARTVEMASRVGKPLVIHVREAHSDAIDILRETGGGALRGVMHCYTGTAEQARPYLDLGLHLSFSGILTFPKSHEIQEAAKVAPADRILVETDSPYLAPVPHRGKRNEPAYLVYTVAFLAGLRGLSTEEAAALTAANARELFSLPEPAV